MTTWAIGDLQGCYDATQRLLERIAFDPARDTLWFCGDLVNRGGQSLETLRLVHSLRASAVVVLGNHDLSLLAIGERREEEQRKVNPDLQRVVLAPDRDELLGWLRMQKLVHVDRALGWMMVHAGLAPQWTTQDAERYGREIEQRLRGDQFRRLLKNMYGDGPTWHSKLAGLDRDRAIINICTRMRYCSPRGRISFDDKGGPGTQPVGLYPWYAVPGRAERDLRIVCGHWSTLGLFIGHGVHAIDTGAVWGGKLTALQLDTEELRVVQVAGRDVPATPPKPRPPQQQQRPTPGRDAVKPPARAEGSPGQRENRPPNPPANQPGQHHPGQPRREQRPQGRRPGQQPPQQPRPATDPSSQSQRAQGPTVQDPPPGGRPTQADGSAKGDS